MGNHTEYVRFEESDPNKKPKYDEIDSLICDQSLVYTKDMKFATKQEYNFLHILVRPDQM